MITIVYLPHTRFIHSVIEKISLFMEKCGVMKALELSPSQHKHLINTIDNGDKFSQEIAIRYYMNLIDHNQQMIPVEADEKVVDLQEDKYGLIYSHRK
jgi:hypothetical protein